MVVVLLVFSLFQALNHVVLKKVAAQLPYSEKLIRVTSITHTSIHGYFTLGKAGQRGTVPHFEVHYNIADLLDEMISEVVLDSANFDIVLGAGGAGLAHFPESGGRTKAVFPAELPVALKKLTLQNCMLRIAKGSKRLLVDITGSIDVDYEEERKIPAAFDAVFDVRAHGLLAKLQLQSKRDFAGYEHTFSVTGEDLSLFTPFISGGSSAAIDGKSEISGIIKTKEDLTPVSFDMNIAVAAAKFQNKRVILATKQGHPFKADVQFDGETVHAAFHGLRLTSPFQSTIVGKMRYALADRRFDGYLRGEESAISSSFTFSGNHDSEKVRVTWKVTGDTWDMGNGIKIVSPEGSGTLDYSNSGLQGEVKAHVQSVAMKKEDLLLKDIDFSFEKISGNMTDAVFTGQGIARVGSIYGKGMALAAMETEMKMESEQMLFQTEIKGVSLPKMHLTCSGSAKLAGTITGECSLPETTVTRDDVLPLVAVPEDVAFSGGISGWMNFNYSLGKLRSNASFQLQEGDVTWGEDGHISNIATTITFPDMADLHSRPRQLLEIERGKFGKLELENVKINYRIDAPDSLFVERIMMNWCGGRVQAAGFYLNKEMETFSTTLFCDRIGYADLLGQLGVGRAEGEGALNGRLPLAISEDGLYFDDGFLFSTPGQGGILRFSNTDTIRRGMPAVDQVAYLDYSLDALRNFSYNWTKLRFNTEEHNLLLALQLEGQPVSPLPYGYEGGKIVKKLLGKGIQHPIRLDVNFRFPTEDIFRYSKGIGSIMEKIK